MEREPVMVTTLPELSVPIREHGRITISEVVRAGGINRNTRRGALKSLVAQGHLQLHGVGRGA